MSEHELRAALKDAVRILGGGRRGYVGDHWIHEVQVNEATIDRLRAALAAPSTPEPSGPDTEGTTFCPCGAAWIGTRVHGATEQRSHAEFHASGGPGLGAPHDPGLATFVPDRAAPSTLRPCATCGHAAGGHMPECTNGICKCRRFRAAPSTPEPSGPIDYNPYPNPFDENGDFIDAAPSTEPALDVDTLVVAMLEAVKGVALRHGIRPTEFLDAANAAANEVRRLAESQP